MVKSVKRAITDFTSYLKNAGRSSFTVLAYGNDLKQFEDYLSKLNIQFLDQINDGHLKDFLNYLKENLNLTQKSLSRKINSVKSFFRYLEKIGAINNNPSFSLSHPKIETKPPRILTPTEYMALREASRKNIRTYTMVEVLLQTGIRISELAEIEMSHLDLGENPTLFIPKKESQKERIINLNKKVRDVILEYIKQKGIKEGPLFPTKSGRKMLVRNIRFSLDRVFKKAGLKDVAVNDLRHTFVAHQIKSGVSLQKIKDVCGHKNIITTKRYLKYLDIKTQGQKQNIEEL